MIRTTIKFVLAIVITGVSVLGAQSAAFADTTSLSPYSWDSGLYATANSQGTTVHAWGQRTTSGAWGTGPVNYQSGATTAHRVAAAGSLNVTLNGTYCPGGACTYGSGSGYKGLVQFWNDPSNFIAVGLIHDPGVSPNGMTLMIEGSAAGKPIGGYWPAGAITGSSHLFTLNWQPGGLSFVIDNSVHLGPYPVAENNPSVSFLAAGRDTGDITDTTFTGISFSPGSTVPAPVVVPAGNPYFSYSTTLTQSGSGTGHSAYINSHDANNNAISVGIQSDTASTASNGQPYFIWERVQGGNFTFAYLGAAPSGAVGVTLKWWANGTAVFYEGATPIANIPVSMTPRLFFNAEGNARVNGDTVSDTFSNVQITAGNSCPTYCGLNGSWNTSSFNFYGLKATDTNGQPQNGANFTVTGRVSGLSSGQTWDTNEVAGIAMIAQYWAGQ
jgi:hypothetical protein